MATDGVAWLATSAGEPVSARLITLTTDFGDSPYAGAVRGTLLARAPRARIVDVTHAIPAGDVTAGALGLVATLPFFPKATPAEPMVHLAVVDPGVGTARRGLALACEGCTLVGPDNGLLHPVAERLGLREARAITEPGLWLDTVSPTFHGRDVFAPVAAYLHEGGALEGVGPKVELAGLARLPHAARGADAYSAAFGVVKEENGALVGRVLVLDAFGNAVTNIPESVARRFRAAGTVNLEVAGVRHLLPFKRTYGEVPEGRALVLVGSSGFVEIAVNRGSAGDRFHLRPGQGLRLGP